ncbi:hypothetical protein MAA_10950 [Metarhizium robertsii ARSEF 23]|uniref:Uncharacterized protein n=1 Tax=Metarhizium robertsii (strain ARSEF 23 / ATCC MYA-3075) TaxID=655844 RepID=A0A0B2XHH6_METRA|nr:uncharacterized protein MAA_10950 [Metarhizium robertsii ARSEF 23]KHO11434.1 hypothetical protein MAA_10950 [Metarhizium robertsii ARSEF 23]
MAPRWECGRLEPDWSWHRAPGASLVDWSTGIRSSQFDLDSSAVSTALCCARCDRPTAQGRWTWSSYGVPPTLNASCPSRCHAKHPPARPEVPATYAQAAVTTTQGHSRPLNDLQTAQVPRLDTLQRHAPVTPLLLDPHLAFIVSPRPGV